MGEFIARRIEAYHDRISSEASARSGGGEFGVDIDALRKIVREEPPEVTELVVRTQIEGYAGGSPDRLTLAVTLATLYHQEFGDGTLLEMVSNVAGGETVSLTVGYPDGGRRTTSARLGPARVIRAINIDDEDPREGSVRHIVRIFRELVREPSRAATVRGQFALSFPRYDDDPRPNFAIPEARACIAALDAQLPYFLYYLQPDPYLEQVVGYVNSLISLRRFEFLPGTWRYTGPTSELIGFLLPRLAAVRTYCGQVGDDRDEVTASVLQAYPEPLVDALMAAFRSVDGG